MSAIVVFDSSGNCLTTPRKRYKKASSAVAATTSSAPFPSSSSTLVSSIFPNAFDALKRSQSFNSNTNLLCLEFPTVHQNIITSILDLSSNDYRKASALIRQVSDSATTTTNAVEHGSSNSNGAPLFYRYKRERDWALQEPAMLCEDRISNNSSSSEYDEEEEHKTKKHQQSSLLHHHVSNSSSSSSVGHGRDDRNHRCGDSSDELVLLNSSAQSATSDSPETQKQSEITGASIHMGGVAQPSAAPAVQVSDRRCCSPSVESQISSSPESPPNVAAEPSDSPNEDTQMAAVTSSPTLISGEVSLAAAAAEPPLSSCCCSFSNSASVSSSSSSLSSSAPASFHPHSHQPLPASPSSPSLTSNASYSGGMKHTIQVLSRIILKQSDRISSLVSERNRLVQENKKLQTTLDRTAEELSQSNDANQMLKYFVSSSNPRGTPNGFFNNNQSSGGGNGFEFWDFPRSPDVF